MIKKIGKTYYLGRAEAIDYLTQAYQLKWCMTKWSANLIYINFATANGRRYVIKVPTYMAGKISKACLSQRDLDLEMLKVLN